MKMAPLEQPIPTITPTSEPHKDRCRENHQRFDDEGILFSILKYVRMYLIVSIYIGMLSSDTMLKGYDGYACIGRSTSPH